ncbi:MAG TPA: FAD binding domain-containing protein [Ktedonobacteraceae bacterium]|nr:FAD binding domain-containing protein [Ktedonobacteraceae bacterium]
MLLNLMEYHWAEQIDDALLLLSRSDIKTVPLAGGTYLLGQRDDSIQAVVDLRDLELSYITEDARGVHIGAMTTLQNMVESPLLQEFAGGILVQAALASSFSRLIRNSATIGGTLGAGTASQADVLTALAVLSAEVVVRSASKTQVNLSGGTLERPGLALSGVTFKGKHERHILLSSLAMDRRPSELMIEVLVPRPGAASGAVFRRVGRTPTDVALLNVAALVQITDGVYQRVRLAFGGVNMDVQRIFAIERQLEGQPVPAADIFSKQIVPVVQSCMDDFRPSSDFRASADYRRVSGTSMAYHALEEATNNALRGDMASSEGSK